MRTLLTPPEAIFDPVTREARVGSYLGALPRVDLSPRAPRALDRLLKHKRWMYLAVSTGDVFIAVAVVHLGYAAQAFAFAFEKSGRRMLSDRSALAPPFAASVGDAAGEGSSARFRLPGARVRIERPRGDPAMSVEVVFGAIALSARVDSASAPPPISALALIPGGSLSATEKRTLLPCTGRATIHGRSISLDGALAGYDYTSGLLPRRTTWRWGFALGRARTGERVAWNLVEGFVGEAECAAWIEGDVVPLSEGRFSFDRARPLDPWRVGTAHGEVDLRFTPGAAHAEHKNLGVIASRFVQPVGVYSGSIRIPGGRRLELDEVLGVTEDQDVLW